MNPLSSTDPEVESPPDSLPAPTAVLPGSDSALSPPDSSFTPSAAGPSPPEGAPEAHLPLLLQPLGPQRPWKERLATCNGCDRCGDRCVSGYPISHFEYRRIRDYLERQDPVDRERVAVQEKNVPWPGAPEITYEACRFRDRELGRCSIYPVRPLICRVFGHVEWLPCPVGIVPDAAPEGVSLMQWYGRRELRTYEEWEEASDAPGD